MKKSSFIRSCSGYGRFLQGDYLPLRVTGCRREYVCSFARHLEDLWTITAVPRLVTKLAEPGPFPLGEGVWGRAMIVLPPEAPGDWVDLFSGQRLVVERSAVPVGAVFSRLPFALLAHEPAP